VPRVGGGGRTRPPVQSVARAAGLLQQLAAVGRPASLAELAAACGLERTTAWRLLTTLEACGLVDRDSSSDGFRVGFGTVAVAAAALGDGTALASRVRPELCRLSEATGEAAAVCLVRGTRVLVVDQVDPPSVVSVSWIGRQFPLHASSPGKLVLASLAPDDLERFLAEPLQALTERTITDAGALRRDLARVRATGIAASDEEFERGCVGFSAAVTDWADRPIAIVGVTGPNFRMRRNRFPFYRQEVLRSAHAAAAALGYDPASRSASAVSPRRPGHTRRLMQPPDPAES
jgi:DNA-binding IclR family transcriptional regulator